MWHHEVKRSGSNDLSSTHVWTFMYKSAEFVNFMPFVLLFVLPHVAFPFVLLIEIIMWKEYWLVLLCPSCLTIQQFVCR